MDTSMLDFIKTLARDAGALIVRERSSFTSDFKANSELVTSADLSADRFICAAIRAQFPDHLILAEESAPDISRLHKTDQPVWIIDPIDGTVNYAHGHYQVAISIAWVKDGDIHTGVVYNPFLDELFCAQLGAGAWLNEKPIQVGRQTDLRRCLIATGFPYAKDNLAPLIKRLAVILDNCADVRRLGSAALDICWVAMGRLDGYYESLILWDFAAAQLIAREAGARYGHFKDLPPGISPVFHNEHILVANPVLFPQLKTLLERT
jgi:myo-inositol-1(or 4)-monophosphatase